MGTRVPLCESNCSVSYPSLSWMHPSLSTVMASVHSAELKLLSCSTVQVCSAGWVQLHYSIESPVLASSLGMEPQNSLTSVVLCSVEVLLVEPSL